MTSLLKLLNSESFTELGSVTYDELCEQIYLAFEDAAQHVGVDWTPCDADSEALYPDPVAAAYQDDVDTKHVSKKAKIVDEALVTATQLHINRIWEEHDAVMGIERGQTRFVYPSTFDLKGEEMEILTPMFGMDYSYQFL